MALCSQLKQSISVQMCGVMGVVFLDGLCDSCRELTLMAEPRNAPPSLCTQRRVRVSTITRDIAHPLNIYVRPTETGICTLSRYILLDSILMFFIIASVYCYCRFYNTRRRCVGGSRCVCAGVCGVCGGMGEG